jgi:hypothetical protein
VSRGGADCNQRIAFCAASYHEFLPVFAGGVSGLGDAGGAVGGFGLMYGAGHVPIITGIVLTPAAGFGGAATGTGGTGLCPNSD